MIKNKSILIKNIYYMLSYAFTDLSKGEYESLASEEFDNIHNLFAAILSKGISRQLKQGLFKEYQTFTDDLHSLRGKINLPGTIKNKMARKQLLSCEYDELTENNLLNRILKTTMLLLLSSRDVDTEYKATLKKELLFFSAVDSVDPYSIEWPAIRFHRNSGSYKLLISICQLTIQGLLLSTDEGENKLASFLDDQRMNRLYEKFILEYYKKEHTELKATASQIAWALDDGVSTFLPVMQSDITLTSSNRILIIDAKFYSHTMQSRYDSYSLHSGNLYQIYTYVKNTAAGHPDSKVSGLLLYAGTDETIQPDNTYAMSGNRISVKTLDLNQKFTTIANQLDSIAAGLSSS